MLLGSLRKVCAIARRRLSDRAHYRRVTSWWLSLYNRALLRLPVLPFRDRICSVAPVATNGRIHLRLGTSDWYVFEEIFVRKDYEAAVEQTGTAKTVLDLGANIGLSVRYWQDRFPSAFVVAVEADRENARICGLNVRQERTTIIQACAAGSSGSVFLNRSTDAWAYQMTREPQGEAIRAVTVQELLKEADVKGDVDLLKCDIEGAEAEVFGDCQGWIGRVRVLVVEVHSPYSSAQLMRDVGPLFEAFRRVPVGPGEVIFLNRRLPSLAVPRCPGARDRDRVATPQPGSE